VAPTAFASTDPLDLDEVEVRLPRPSRLAEPLVVRPAVAAEAAEALGLHTVGDLLEHLPRDSGEARTIAELVPEQTATVLVEVRSIISRPVRRRGMKPLVEATVMDGTGVMKVTFFNQPWLERQYRTGTRLMLSGKYEARNRFKVSFHAPTELVSGEVEGVATYPATRSPRSPTRCPGGCAPPRGCPTGPGRSPRRTSATARAAAAGWPSTSCCSTRSCSCGCATSGATRCAPRR
jgi:ATP-dependent DNA helicase RecG